MLPFCKGPGARSAILRCALVESPSLAATVGDLTATVGELTATVGELIHPKQIGPSKKIGEFFWAVPKMFWGNLK